MLDLTVFDGDELLALARIDADAGNIDQSLAKVKQAMRLSEYPNGIKSLAARLYAQLRLFDRAKPLYEEFVALFPRAIDERFQLGMVTMEMGDLQQALDLWENLRQSHPTHPPMLYYSAIAKAELGQIDAAKHDLNVLTQAIPVDNMYFKRGRDLLQAIERSAGRGALATGTDRSNGSDQARSDAYASSEH